MIKYNPTIQNLKKYLVEFKYSKCKSCGKLFYPYRKICFQCRKECKISEEVKKAVLLSFTVINTSQLIISNNYPVIMGLIKVNDEIILTKEITDIKEKDVKIGMKLKPVLRKIFKDKLLGYIQYGIKFTKI